MSRPFRGFIVGVVVDVETTGLSPILHRVVSIAAIRVNFYELVSSRGVHADTFAALVNPRRKILASATEIHGITDYDVHDEDPFGAIAEKLRDFIGDDPIIGHNVEFDKSFLSAELKRAKVQTLRRNRSFCTMQRLCALLRARGVERHRISLPDACEEFSIPFYAPTQHDAMEDAKATLQLAGAIYKIDNSWA